MKLFYKFIITMILVIVLSTGCSTKETITINREKNILKDRYNAPKNFERIEVEKNSFEEFLRNSELKDYGQPVKYYNRKTKKSNGIYDSVFKVDIGDRDLHQCADAIMLLKAEYLYKNQRYDEIHFNFVDGFNAKYSKWMEGYRIKVNDNGTTWYKQASYDDSYETFRKYMDMVFAYSSTLSLDKEATSVNFEDMKIGDIFIVGGSPGHAVIVVDMAENKVTGEKVFMLAQSYMPAQETQLLINPNNSEISPWYSMSFDGKLITPEWSFEKSNLKSI